MDGGVILSSFAEVVLGKAGEYASHQILLAWDSKTQLTKLENSLRDICAVLQDAERKQATNNGIREWLKNLKDVVYDIDDLLDEAATNNLRREVNEGNFAAKARYCFSSSNPVISSFLLSRRIQGIRERLDDIAANKRDFQLTSAVDSLEPPQVSRIMQRKTFPHVSKSNIVGRDIDKKKVLSLLSSFNDSNRRFSVMPVTGIGGIGKTALAKLVYQDDWVAGNFEIRVWACASDKAITTEDAVSRIGESISVQNTIQMLVELRKLLVQKRYFMVLDDVWMEDVKEWDDMRPFLDVGKHGSVIVVSTRTARVASIVLNVKDSREYPLGRLSNEDCLTIFKRYAFVEGDEARYPNLVKIGKAIVEKCCGVPLAAKTLGSLLYGVKLEEEWVRIRESKLSDGDNDIIPTLKLSYDALPSHLKPCFAYMSMYFKDYRIHLEDLVNNWMAQGMLVSAHDSSELERVGERFFANLQAMSFFQDELVLFDESVVHFKMHHLLHDLTAYVMGEEQAIARGDKVENVSTRARHVLCDGIDSSGQQLVKKLLKAKKTRTFWCNQVKKNQPMNYLSKSFLEAVISRFKLLRVLDLSLSDFEELPESVGSLRHLRLINVSDNSMIKLLPSSIHKLLNLQTLYVERCPKFGQLPSKGLEKLVSLRHLSTTLLAQQILSLDGLNHLRVLQLSRCKELTTISESIKNLTNLQKLRILHCPELSSLPNNMKFLTGLEVLVINNCRNLDLMDAGEAMSGLRSLRSLQVESIPKLAAFPYAIESASKSLRYLYIRNCEGLKTLMPGRLGGFTSLLRICIYDCRHLVALPDEIQKLTDLQELNILGCPSLSMRYERGTGIDWNLISNIPNIALDNHWIK